MTRTAILHKLVFHPCKTVAASNSRLRRPSAVVLVPLRLILAWFLLCVGVAKAEEDVQIVEAPITDFDRKHWSFQPLTRPAVPKVSDSAWIENEIDSFILVNLEAKRIAPQPRADRVTLIHVPVALGGPDWQF